MDTQPQDQTNLATATRELEDDAAFFSALAARQVRTRQEAARRAARNGTSATYIVSCARRNILSLLATGETADDIAAIFLAARPVRGVTEKDLAVAIQRMAAREKSAATNATRASAGAQAPTDREQPADISDTPAADTQVNAHADAAKPASSGGPAGTVAQPVAQAAAAATAAAPQPPTNTGGDDPRYRREPPFWVNDARYRELACLQRHDDEADADYNSRMWHTPPHGRATCAGRRATRT